MSMIEKYDSAPKVKLGTLKMGVHFWYRNPGDSTPYVFKFRTASYIAAAPSTRKVLRILDDDDVIHIFTGNEMVVLEEEL